MQLSSGLSPRRSKLWYRAWAAVFVLMLAGSVYLLYYATKQVDYVWRWYRIPQYFWYVEQVETRSMLDGDIAAVEQGATGTVITVTGLDGEVERYTVPGGGELRVSQGDMVSSGDVLGFHEVQHVGIMVEAAWLTLKVSFLSIVIGIGLGVLTGLARLSHNPALRWTAITYIELIRGSPLLVQIYIWYFVFGTLINQLLGKYGLPQPSALWYGVASMAMFTGAYVAEIVRAGIQSVHRGQVEAARSLGMTSFECLRHVVLPQAIRRILPPLAGQFISLVKDSSLLGIIALRELTKATRELITSNLQPFEMWFVCAMLYLVMTFALSMLLQWFERKWLTS
ncbi:MAG: ABC transporter permease subunit [Desulfovibrio sp.]|nr:ABC transporter permease subunit [Desulfovibrio sp.]MCA1985940.1 ABC transporter permease subunit [Desulfovibrio sp.]